MMKALEKDRTRSYETANGLALAIQRHVNREPVIERPPSQLSRFAGFFYQSKGDSRKRRGKSRASCISRSTRRFWLSER